MKSWNELFEQERGKPYFKNLMATIEKEYRENTCYPPFPDIFKALLLTPLESVKCVIVGQDPYHTPGQAMGLSFSVPRGRPLQPSLQNIFQELHQELGVPVPTHGDLTQWAGRGVLLLNATLTVRAHSAGSHQNLGWEKFTDEVLAAVDGQDRPIVYMLWGRYARDKGRLLLNKDHLILESPHPSPFSANSGFFGNGHFKKCNQFLAGKNIEPIDWTIN